MPVRGLITDLNDQRRGLHMTRWEYACLTESGDVSLAFSHRPDIRLPERTPSDIILRNLGDDGWEMVSYTPKTPGGYSTKTWFKRPMVR